MFNFSKTRAFGLDLSDTSIEVLQFKARGKKVKVSAYGRMTFKPGLIENGIIKKPGELAEMMQLIIKHTKPKAIRSKKVISAIPESQTYSLIISLPLNIPEEEIAEELKKIAQNRLPLDIDDTLVDYKLLGQNNNLQDFSYIVCPKNIIRNYLQIFELAGLDLIVLEVESLALARSLLKWYNKDEAYLICDLGARTTNINIFDHQGIRYSEVVKIAGNYFTTQLSEELKITWVEAETLRIKEGLKNYDVSKVLKPIFKKLQQVIDKAIKYYQRENQRAITKIYLAGGCALMTGLREDFESNLKIQVFAPKDAIYAPVMGLAFRALANKPETLDINLLKYLNNN